MDAIVAASLLASSLIPNMEAVKELQKQYLYDAMIAFRQDMLMSNIMDEEEIGRYFVHPHRFEDDKEVMVDRMKKMKPNCPPWFDYKRLPPHSIAMKHYWLSRQFLDWLIMVRPYYGPVEQLTIDLNIEECKWRLQVWDLIGDASVEYGNCWRNEGRRIMLQRLRELIGTEPYNECKWPNPLPDIAYSGLWIWWRDNN